MRKYLATFAVLITLFGMFAPYGFSATSFQKNTALANFIDPDVSFGQTISITKTPGKPSFFRLESAIRYDDSGYVDGWTLPSAGFSSVVGTYEPHFKVINTVSGETLEDARVDNPEDLGLKNNVFGPIYQDIKIDTAGKYEAWFYESYLLRTDLASSKIKFEIDTAGNIVNQQISYITNNVRGDQIYFPTRPTATIDETKPEEVKISSSIKYVNDNYPSPSTKDAPVNISWVLTNPGGTSIIQQQSINIDPVPKYGVDRPFSVIVGNLTPGESYGVYILENEIKNTAGQNKRSGIVTFTAGQADSVQVPVPQPISNPTSELQNSFECDEVWQFRCHLVMFTVDIITFIPMAIATLTGLLSDVFLSLAIDPTMYGAGNGLGKAIDGFLYTSWSIVRDFANIGFIFALFVAAFSLIAGKDFLGFKPKDTVVRVIVMALLVNFSFFFCRMIIQTADVFSNVLYNQLEIQTSSTGTIASWAQGAGIKSPSFALVSQVNPQSLFTAAGIKREDTGSFTAYLIVGFLGGAAYWIMIFVFVSMMLVWIGRIFGAWIAIILSPLAFVSWSIPFLEKDKHIGFQNWLTNLVQLSFMVPVYLFFIYLVIGVLNLTDLNKVVSGLQSSSGYLVAVMAIVMKTLIPLFGAMFILIRAKKIAYDMSGQIGVMVNGLAGKASTLALGAATGGTAFMARQTLGRAGAAVANSGAVKSMSRNKFAPVRWAGAGIGAAGRSTAASSFDVRNSPSIMKRFGQFTEKAGEKIDLGNKMLNTTGFKGEGGLRDIKRKIRNSAETKIMEWNKKTMEDQKLDDSSSAERDKREAEDKKARADQALAAERSKIEFEAQNQTLVSALKKLTNQMALLGGDLDGMTAERDELEAIPRAYRTDEQIARLEKLKTDIPSLERVKKQEANALIAQNEGATDVHSAQKIAANLNLVAKNSREKGAVDDAKKSMDDAKTKMSNTNKELADLNKDLKNLDATDDAELYAKTEADIKKKKEDLVKDRKAFDESRTKHKSAEDDYKRIYGDRIKGLENFAKEAVDNYKTSDDVKERVKIKQDVVVQSQIEVNNYQTKIDDTNYRNQSEYMSNVEQTAENIANPRSGLKGWVDTLKGSVVGNAAMRSADSFRQDLNNRKTTASIEPIVPKKDTP